ncbi:hypothetical protein BD779DRAFT_1476102 [Infundibulicybe gibba]|nr:hypothetical protein BD779DRAFT_1476102 [Infundibulicybe gibba]
MNLRIEPKDADGLRGDIEAETGVAGLFGPNGRKEHKERVKEVEDGLGDGGGAGFWLTDASLVDLDPATISQVGSYAEAFVVGLNSVWRRSGPSVACLNAIGRVGLVVCELHWRVANGYKIH